MITTMMWVIIVIISLVLLMILVLKYQITWYWYQNIRENMVEKRIKQFGQGSPPPFFCAMPERKHFFSGLLPLFVKGHILLCTVGGRLWWCAGQHKICTPANVLVCILHLIFVFLFLRLFQAQISLLVIFLHCIDMAISSNRLEYG